MGNIIFDVTKLNNADRKIYEAMTESEKKSFESTWVLLEEQKLKLQQKKNASKERAAREKKALADKERRERNHRLIERGAILEANIKDPHDFTNDEIKKIVMRIFRSQTVINYIEDVRAEHVTQIDESDSSTDSTSFHRCL